MARPEKIDQINAQGSDFLGKASDWYFSGRQNLSGRPGDQVVLHLVLGRDFDELGVLELSGPLSIISRYQH